MSKLKPYLDDLENKDGITKLGKKIVDIELQIDKCKTEKQIINEKIIGIKRKLKKLENDVVRYPENGKIKTQFEIKTKKLEKSCKKLYELDELISEKEYLKFKLNEESRDAIRMGMIDLFHKAKIEHEDARHSWIKHNALAIKAHEKMKKKKKEIDTIKQVFKAEFGDK